jgi:hypothetical protein
MQLMWLPVGAAAAGLAGIAVAAAAAEAATSACSKSIFRTQYDVEDQQQENVHLLLSCVCWL